jgi:hypothetical protein
LHVLPKGASLAAVASPGQLAVVNVSADGAVVVDRRAKITTDLRAIGGDRLGVPVAFYDGDPQQGGKLFDFQTIPRLRADRPYRLRAFLRAEACGAHTIVVVAGGRATFTPSRASLDLTNATVTVASALREIGGTGELVDRVAAGNVLLVARPGSRADSAVFELRPASDRPSISLQLTERSSGIAEFKLNIDRAVLSRAPRLCSTGPSSATVIETHFEIDDGQHAPVEVAITRPWQRAGRPPRPGSQLKAR